MLINYVHTFFTGPLLIYIGYTKTKCKLMHNLLIILGVAIILAFLNRWYNKELYAWLFVHLLLFASLLIYVGYKQGEAPKYLYSFLLAIGIAATGFHGIKVVEEYVKND